MAKRPSREGGEQLRLFVALELPDEVRQAIGQVQDGLRRAGAGHLRWVRPEGIHITLKFLGETDAALVEAIVSALEAAIEPFELRLRLAGLGGFGGARLRVVWVGLEGDLQPLSALAERVEAALAPLGFPRERRPFSPHLTLARVPDAASPAERRELAGLIQRYTPPPLPAMILKEVRLMRSVLRPDGAVYQQVASFPPSGRGSDRLTGSRGRA